MAFRVKAHMRGGNRVKGHMRGLGRTPGKREGGLPVYPRRSKGGGSIRPTVWKP